MNRPVYENRPMSTSNSNGPVIRCVFHSDQTPSMSVSPNGRYFCYGCGAKGAAKDHPIILQAWLEAVGQLRLPIPGI